MRRIVEIVSKDEYEDWVSGLQSHYMTNVRGAENDPNKDKLLLDYEIGARKAELDATINPLWSKLNPANALTTAKDTTAAKTAPTEAELTLRLKNVFYETGSAKLNELSYNEIDYIAELLTKYPYIKLQVAGHTDNVGDAAANRVLSQQRASSVRDRLVSKGVSSLRLNVIGFGDTVPIESNDKEEGRKKNRRTELKVIK
jgi:outer membrane protein OmpA-like peptidoglycan-associated protein